MKPDKKIKKKMIRKHPRLIELTALKVVNIKNGKKLICKYVYSDGHKEIR